MSLHSRLTISGLNAARPSHNIKSEPAPRVAPHPLQPTFARILMCLGSYVLTAGLAATPAAFAQPSASNPFATNLELPDSPTPRLSSTPGPIELALASQPDSDETSALQASPQQTPAQQPSPAASPEQTPPAAQPPQSIKEEDLKREEHQRIFGVIPAFNAVNNGSSLPLTPRQKFQLMFKSTTDPYIFAFAAVTAGIGQAQNSHAGYGQGAEGYAKRFGANYVDTADGNFWGNAVLPILWHEDPRYFRLGEGTLTHRILYSMSTTVWCRRDNGTWGPNYANLVGNLIAGGISNAYYPEADRGVGQTFQSAATVTAEGMIGAALIEFWPDITQHYHLKRQAKRDAAAAAAAAQNSQTAKPSPQ